MLKRLALSLASLFLAYHTYRIVYQLIHYDSSQTPVWLCVLLAFLVNLFATGIFAFFGFAYPSSKVLPDAYYQIRKPLQLQAAYNILGVEYFKKALLLAFWGKENNRKRYFNGTRAGIQAFDFQTRQSEFGHLVALLLILVIALILLIYGHTLIALFATVINLLGNLYPVLLQRKHRSQIQRLLNRPRS